MTLPWNKNKKFAPKTTFSEGIITFSVGNL